MKIGFLPLYIELYDKVVPEQRARHEAHYERLAKKMISLGIDVVRTQLCRVKAEFENAIKLFEENDVDAIVTIHMAYSPSGEYYEVLSKTKLPIIVLDATETNDFSDNQNSEEISYCHGIHGVMDMCCMLKRNCKPFAICAGCSDDEQLFEKLKGYIKAASCAKAFLGSSVGMIGTKFEGMEDFSVPYDVLSSRFGSKVISAQRDELLSIAKEITDAEVEAEVNAELKLGNKLREFGDDVHKKSAKANLVMRKWIEKYKLDAVTVNFLDVTDAGLDTMPFMEACLAMQRGVGYAGEGDAFTASLVGALLKNYKETSFVEIFCPDWKNDALFISHMGEMNYAVADREIELFENPFIYGNGTHTVVGTASFKPGKAVFVNLFPTNKDFGMVISPVEVLKENTDNFAGNIRGWIKPNMKASEFLEKISMAGVTHHSALVYGATTEELKFMAECLEIDAYVIE